MKPTRLSRLPAAETMKARLENDVFEFVEFN
jgi:hypothetical protein